MELLKELLSIIASASVPIAVVAVFALRLQSTKTKELEKDLRETNIRILKLSAIIVKYCSAPIEIVLDELKDQKEFLISVSDDDILGQILDKYVRN